MTTGCQGEPHTCDQELVAAAEGRTDRVILERDELREALSNLLDAMADQGAATWKKALERACMLSGRYIEPYTALVDPAVMRRALGRIAFENLGWRTPQGVALQAIVGKEDCGAG